MSVNRNTTLYVKQDIEKLERIYKVLINPMPTISVADDARSCVRNWIAELHETEYGIDEQCTDPKPEYNMPLPGSINEIPEGVYMGPAPKVTNLLKVPTSIRRTALEAFRYLQIIQLTQCSPAYVVMIQSSNLPKKWIHYNEVLYGHLNLESIIWDILDLKQGLMLYGPEGIISHLPLECFKAMPEDKS
jgi:hypothetical protein